jgi:hypothetical protein
MANFTQLRDLYAFPGFVPDAHIRGVFGDPYAVVITLRRLRKKLCADSAAPAIAPSTIRPPAASAISTAEAVGSTFSSPSGGSIVGGAGL